MTDTRYLNGIRTEPIIIPVMRKHRKIIAVLLAAYSVVSVKVKYFIFAIQITS